MTAIGFDNSRYLQEQTAAILERVARSSGKLYLEFGGKLTDDQHAARVLPGYDPNVKMRLLQGLRDQAEIVFCVYAADIEEGRIRGATAGDGECSRPPPPRQKAQASIPPSRISVWV